MSGDKKPIIHVDEIRQVLFFSDEFATRQFTIMELIEKINSTYPNHEPANVAVVDAYLYQIERAVIVEKRRGSRTWQINTPDPISPCCGK